MNKYLVQWQSELTGKTGFYPKYAETAEQAMDATKREVASQIKVIGVLLIDEPISLMKQLSAYLL